MELLLFATYLVLFAWLVTYNKFFKSSGLTASQLVIIFLLKVIAGIIYGRTGAFYGEMNQMVDTWYFHFESIKEQELLLRDPVTFFTSLFDNPYENGYLKFFSSKDSWWNDLQENFLIKLLALFNLASFQQYYINVIFYSFFTLFGPIALYKVMRDVFPKNKTEVLLATFLLPSFLFWTSGIHKDGILFIGFALVIYNTYFGLKSSFSFKKWILIVLGLLIILIIRNYFLVILLPALLAWIVAVKAKIGAWKIFIPLYSVCFLLFFTARYIHPALDFPAVVAEKQGAFLGLQGGSYVPVNRLQPTFKSFLINAPQALDLTLLRPYPTEIKHRLSLAAAIELYIIIGCFFVFLLFRKKSGSPHPFLLFCLFFSFSAFLIIGYTVNFTGAIVRYRSLVLPFVVIPMVASTNWKLITKRLGRRHYI